MNLLGTLYVTAGNGKEGFDCSGYTYYVFQHFDIEVPRSTAGYENFGNEIPVENVQKGDLSLFLSPTRDAIGHIGIVSNTNGNESDFIHAASGSELKVMITNLSNEGYTRRFIKAIRVYKKITLQSSPVQKFEAWLNSPFHNSKITRFDSNPAKI